MQKIEGNVPQHRAITLALLAAVFAVHFLDRRLLAILIPPIKAELNLSDAALGFLSGFAFTVFSSTVGLAIARLADRADRARRPACSSPSCSAPAVRSGLTRADELPTLLPPPTREESSSHSRC